MCYVVNPILSAAIDALFTISPVLSATITNTVPTTVTNSLSSIVTNNVDVTVTNAVSSTVINTSYGGGLFTVSQDYLFSISEGDITGHTQYEKAGYSNAGTTTETTVWPVATSYVFPVSAQAMQCVSSSTQDSATGTGIKTIRIFYLDGTGTEKTTDVALSGTSAVTTSATDIFRINDVRAVNFGTGTTTWRAVGNVDVRSLFTAPTYARIAVGYNRGKSAVYTIPNGKTVYITSIIIGITKGSTTGNTAIFTCRSSTDLFMGPLLPRGLFMTPIFEINMQDGAFERQFEVPLKLLQNTDFRVDVICGQSSSICTATLRGWTE